MSDECLSAFVPPHPSGVSSIPHPAAKSPPELVYHVCMTRTNIDIDDEACTEVMRRYGLSTKREAVNYALRTIAVEAVSLEEALAMEGAGWEGDLDEMRTSAVYDPDR